MLASPQLNESNIVHQPRFDARVSALVARDVLQLAQEIGTTVLKTSTDKAVIFSPLSIFGVLSILLMGSNGQTYSELMHLLNFNEGTYASRTFFAVPENNFLSTHRSIFGTKLMESARRVRFATGGHCPRFPRSFTQTANLLGRDSRPTAASTIQHSESK